MSHAFTTVFFGKCSSASWHSQHNHILAEPEHLTCLQVCPWKAATCVGHTTLRLPRPHQRLVSVCCLLQRLCLLAAAVSRVDFGGICFRRLLELDGDLDLRHFWAPSLCLQLHFHPGDSASSFFGSSCLHATSVCDVAYGSAPSVDTNGTRGPVLGCDSENTLSQVGNSKYVPSNPSC